MIICSLDIGKKGAVIIYDTASKEFICKREYAFTSLNSLYQLLLAWTKECKIDLFIIGEAFGQRVVVKCHSKFYGIVELIGEQCKIPVYYISDSTARAIVLGKGNGRRKDLVQPYYEEKMKMPLSKDTSDAMLFINAYLIQINDKKMCNMWE